jgi:hypothetical protein
MVTKLGNLSSLADIRNTVKKSLADRMDERAKAVWDKDSFFRTIFGEEALTRYADAAAGEDGVLTIAMVREIFGVDKSMPNPKELPSFCDKCHLKFGMAYKYRLIEESGKPSPHWGGQFALVLDARKGHEGKLKIGRFCSECHPKVNLNKKTFWQPFENAQNRLTAIIRRPQEEREKIRLEAERRASEAERKNAQNQKLEGGMKTAAELDELLREGEANSENAPEEIAS